MIYYALEQYVTERLDHWRRSEQPMQLHISTRQSEPEMQLIDGVALIPIEGFLFKNSDFFSRMFGDVSMTEIESLVRSATDDKAVNAIILPIDSPGGTVAGTSDLADAIFEARQVKPVVAVISDMAASGGFYLASQAETVIADRDAIIGSIGTYRVIIDYSAAAEQDGVKVNVVRSAPFKGGEVTGIKIEQAILDDEQRVIDGLNNVFIEDLARGRGRSVAEVQQWADGRVFVGAEALRLGMIDRIGSLGDALDTLRAGSLAGAIQ